MSAKSYDTPIRIWQVLSNENARLVDLSDVMFGLSDYLCSFRAGHFTPNVRPGQTHCERIVQELIQQYQQLSSQKLSEQLNFSLTSEGDRESFERRNRDFFTHYSERIVIPYLYTLFARDQDLVRRVIDKNNKSLW